MQFHLSTLLVLVLSTITIASPLVSRTTSSKSTTTSVSSRPTASPSSTMSASATCDAKMGKKQVACQTACKGSTTCINSCAATAVNDYVGCAPEKRELEPVVERDLASCQDAAENAAVVCIQKCPTTGQAATTCSNKCTMGAEKAIINCA